MKNSNAKDLLGVILMIVGGLWILDNFNFGYIGIPFHSLIFSWHTFFIIAGAILISKHNRSFFGYILIGIGIVGWLRHMPFVPFVEFLNFGDLWPLILLGFGLWLILNKNERNNHDHYEKFGNLHQDRQNFNPLDGETFSNPSTSNASNFPSDFIDENAVFTTTKKLITSQSFKGGKTSSVFGHIMLDLRQAKLAPGEHVLDVSAIFGGVELYIPQDWKVIVNVSSVFGGFDDKRFPNFNSTPSTDSVLVIKGSVVFGGGELSN